jgi:hypothetical protein
MNASLLSTYRKHQHILIWYIIVGQCCPRIPALLYPQLCLIYIYSLKLYFPFWQHVFKVFQMYWSWHPFDTSTQMFYITCGMWHVAKLLCGWILYISNIIMYWYCQKCILRDAIPNLAKTRRYWNMSNTVSKTHV